MRLRTTLATSLATAVAAGVLAGPAGAAVAHVVAPGETLWSIASANNLTTRTVAAFNGLSEDSQVVLGQTIQVPTTVEGYSALVAAGLAPADPTRPFPRRPPRPLRRRTARAPPMRPLPPWPRRSAR